ncbi:MAG: MFS transporter [Thermomicrobiales bacterium]|nr:MFS transporter [Thermomicrobiales bacterium]MCO5222535.1 MFS transporter [Thermomicrobiales bacterium]
MGTNDRASSTGSSPAPGDGTFTVLRLNPVFRRLWMATVSTTLGQWMQSTALGWLALDLSNRSSFVGLVAFAAGIPFLIISIPGGLLLDRYDRRKILICCQAIAATGAILISVDVITGFVEAWHLLVFAFVNGSLQAIMNPAQQAIVPSLVSRARLTNGIALMSAGQNMTRVVGPSVAGAIIGVAGTGAAFLCQAAALVIALGLLLTTRFPAMATRKAVTSLGSAFDGARIVWNRSDLRAIISLVSISILLVFPYLSFLSVFARDVFEIGPEGMGVLMASSGAGAVLGSIFLASRKRQQTGRWYVVSGVVYGFLIAAFAFSPNLLVAVVLLLLAGFLGSAYVSAVNAGIQHRISDETRGRVMSIYMLTWGFTPIGAIAIGAIASGIGISATVAAAALLGNLLLIALYLFDPAVREI